MSATPNIATGYDIAVGVDLILNNAPFPIDQSAIIKAALVSSDHKIAYTSTPIDVIEATPGSDWDAGRIVIDITATSTATIDYQGLALIEIKVTIDGKSSPPFFVPIKLVKGQIP